MLFRVTHTTDLTYSDLISGSVVELRMAPRQEQDQHRLSFTLAIGPSAPAFSYFDWLGNTVHWFTVNALHRQVRVVATSVVETDRPRPEVQRFADRWPVPTDYDYSVLDFLEFGGPVVDAPALGELTALVDPKPGDSLGEVALRMVHLINERFAYKTGVTSAASPITDILAHGSGVCQDFTHLMIGLARHLGVPARYVSGLVHPDVERFRGYTQTHAWCELLFPSAGWIGFDPTNSCLVGPNFVKVAVGRHYGDVPPNKGQYTGVAKESIEVKVHTEPLKAIPPELAAERIEPIDVPTFPPAAITHREFVNQQQEQQQQQ